MFGLLFALPSGWRWAGGATVAGGITGLYAGWREGIRRDVQLRSEGKLAGGVSIGKGTSPLANKSRTIYLLAICLALCVGQTFNWWPSVLFTALAPATMALVGAFFLTASAYMWLWAKWRERNFLTPLLITIGNK
jgi:hypothetical protein